MSIGSNAMQHPKRLSLAIAGAVQGVGFRPFVYRLAKELNLVGWVNNSAGGVSIEVEGSVSQLKQFLHRFDTELPTLAQVRSRQVEWQERSAILISLFTPVVVQKNSSDSAGNCHLPGLFKRDFRSPQSPLSLPLY